MLTILKVSAGTSTDGNTVFSMSVVAEDQGIYEVNIDDVAYTQLLTLIEELTISKEKPALPTRDQNSPEPERPSLDQRLSEEKREALAKILANTPQHSIEGEKEFPQVKITESPGLLDVGFDLDYSAQYDDDTEESDPGEGFTEDEDDYVEPL